MVEIRQVTVEDIDFAAAQTRREGWWSGREDFELYLALNATGCFVAWSAGRRIGVVTTTHYESSGWIGNLLVVPEHRGRGIGRRLMRRALEHLESVGIGTIRLDGDPPGIPLYQSLGFIDEWESLRYRATSRRAASDTLVEPLRLRDAAAIAAFDRPFFGDDRGHLLRYLVDASVSSFVIRKSDQITGFVVVARSSLGLRIGPCVAVDSPSAEALLTAVLVNAEGEVLTVGVPAPNREAKRILESLGFQPTPSSRRMVRGPIRCCGSPERVFAITNGAVG